MTEKNLFTPFEMSGLALKNRHARADDSRKGRAKQGSQ